MLIEGNYAIDCRKLTIFFSVFWWMWLDCRFFCFFATSVYSINKFSVCTWRQFVIATVFPRIFSAFTRKNTKNVNSLAVSHFFSIDDVIKRRRKFLTVFSLLLSFTICGKCQSWLRGSTEDNDPNFSPPSLCFLSIFAHPKRKKKGKIPIHIFSSPLPT